MTHSRFTQLYDLVIGALYHLKMQGETGFFSLRKILRDVLQYPTSPDDIFQIGKYLEAKGYVKCVFTLGDVQIEVTPSGIIHWEHDQQNMERAFESRASKENINMLLNRQDFETETLNARVEIFELIGRILNSTSQIRSQNPDLHKDAEILKLEFEKISPDPEIILTKLFSLDHLPHIRKETLYLRRSVSR